MIVLGRTYVSHLNSEMLGACILIVIRLRIQAVPVLSRKWVWMEMAVDGV
jgi:hypothetical protein